jgi:hypothetical protein
MIATSGSGVRPTGTQKSRKPIELQAGGITVIEDAPTGDVVPSEAPGVTAIQFPLRAALTLARPGAAGPAK